MISPRGSTLPVTGSGRKLVARKNLLSESARVSAIHCQSLSIDYPGGTRAVDKISLKVNPGEIVSLIGPSGCGKTTLLNILAGLIKPSSGYVEHNGEILDSRSQNISRELI